MDITLLYNPTAGKGEFDLDSTLAFLTNYSANILAINTKEDDYRHALNSPADLLIIAGGDGTIEKIIRAMKKQGITNPIAILPFGNANNIANGLCVENNLAATLKSWHKGIFYPLSVGKATTPHTSYYFVESIGWGLFKNLLDSDHLHQHNDDTNKIQAGKKVALKEYSRLTPSNYEITLDSRDYSGHYLWVEIMNSKRMGPALSLAPDAVSHDRFLDVFLVAAHERKKLGNYLKSHYSNYATPEIETIKAKEIFIKTSKQFHIDDELSDPIEHQKKDVIQAHITLTEGTIPVVNTKFTSKPAKMIGDSRPK
ncbi:diacylglycerol/lipid kinase family protein [Echinicola strongylocentroti]|nr:diacylglycerol kinase family protein [Echinicola strongylocentroti]